jgi:Leucine-rich repeat (LRR) protein
MSLVPRIDRRFIEMSQQLKQLQDTLDKLTKIRPDPSPAPGHCIVIEVHTPYSNDSSSAKHMSVKTSLTPSLFSSLSSGAAMNMTRKLTVNASGVAGPHGPGVAGHKSSRKHAMEFEDEKQFTHELSMAQRQYQQNSTTMVSADDGNTVVEVNIECPAHHSVVTRIYIYVRPGQVSVVGNEPQWMCVDSRDHTLTEESKVFEEKALETFVDLDKEWCVEREDPEVVHAIAKALVEEGGDMAQAMSLMKMAADQGHSGAKEKVQEWTISEGEACELIKEALESLHNGEVDHDTVVRKLRDALSRSGLRKLDLRENSVGAQGAGAIAAVLAQSSLTSLYLRDNLIGAEGAGAIAAVLAQSSLTYLDLRKNSIGDEGARAIAAVLVQSSLTHLWVDSNSIGAEGAGAIAAVVAQSSLICLNLGYNSIGAEGAEAIAAVLPQSSLIALGLCNNSIGDEGAEAIAAVLAQSNLTDLDLGGNSISDEGAEATAAVLAQSSLTALNLSNNSIGDEGAGAIAAVLAQSSLIYVYLGANSIDVVMKQRLTIVAASCNRYCNLTF